eukprot:CAMPEP_0194386058 /NCGR_PEP_ID=MMETSP0174-20130528/84232_1 /TAXON_ID=216777 /ORGANISM="Proboscia alata, Strain PI-D3" /LENGTH=403 /DNA_ID=CAMNT_0039174863 /DNA_START=120 /DNA_END=1331 /DNA_ORIENTATION=-
MPMTCISDSSDMPATWLPNNNDFLRHHTRSKMEQPWTMKEEAASTSAVMGGFLELLELIGTLSDEDIEEEFDTTIEAFLDAAYSASNLPEMQPRALREAAKCLIIVARHYVEIDDGVEVLCDLAMNYIYLVNFSSILLERLPRDDQLKVLHENLVMYTNRSLKSCGNLQNVLDGVDPLLVGRCAAATGVPNEESCKSSDDVYLWLRNSIQLNNALSIPEIEMPDGTDQFIADTWAYLPKYIKEQGSDTNFVDDAYMVTHAGCMLDGYGRHQLFVKDAPWIFQYIRENFYKLLDGNSNDDDNNGSLDLVAEFVDMLRGYGCSEENDLQVLHGSRFLYHVYSKSGYSWIPHVHGTNEYKPWSTYDLIHGPWTGMSGLKQREFEPSVPGSYGDTLRAVLRRTSKHI